MSIRQRLYVDGLWLARQACDAVDASLNWVDVGALARQAGCESAANACYFGVCDPDDPASHGPMRALAQALESQGVACLVREEPTPSVECHRCGHGWEHYPAGLLAVDLALAVADDASSDLIDHAVLVTDAHTVEALAALFARRYPGKQVARLTPSLRDLRGARLGQAVSLGRGTTLLRPGCWAPKLRNRTARAGGVADHR